MCSLYGDLPVRATADFISKIPKNISVTQVWVYFGEFLSEYYTRDDPSRFNKDTPNFKPDKKIVDELIKSYDDQHHSGYSHLVVTQQIMKYFSGTMDEKTKEEIQENKE